MSESGKVAGRIRKENKVLIYFIDYNLTLIYLQIKIKNNKKNNF